MKHLASYIIGLSSIMSLFALRIENQIGIGAALDQNRANVESRVRLVQTSKDTGNTNETAVKKNMTALDSFNRTLKTERRLYPTK